MSERVFGWSLGGALCVAAGCLAPGLAGAVDTPALRVVVVPKVVANGQTRDAGALEAWVHQALSAAGHRVVNLDASLKGQAFALSDAVAAGQVPEALSVLNADAAWAVQLECDKDDGHRGAVGLTYYCSFSRSVIRIGQGDTVHSDTASWHDIFGANIAQALFGGNVKKRAPALLASDLQTWTASWDGDGVWDADLRVTGVAQRAQAEAMVSRLEALPGVSGVRLAAFSRTVTQIGVRGTGRDALDRLAEHIEADPGLGLMVTHATGGLIHAELDFGRVHRRKARVLVVPPSSAPPKSVGAMIKETGTSAVRSALANLSWLEAGEVGSGTVAAAKEPVRRAASKAGEPWFAVVSFRSGKEGSGERWLVTASLMATADGAEILASTGQDSDPIAALDAAVRALDARFAEATRDAGTRSRLGLPGDAGEVSARPVRIAALELEPVFPSRAAWHREQGVGTLRLVHQGELPLTGGRLELTASGQQLGAVEVPEVAAGRELQVRVPLDALPALDPDAAHTLQVQATLSYKVGEAFGRERAYAPLVVHRRNTLDWAEPASVAAFVDPTDPEVRSLATQALGAEVGAGVPRPLGRAAAIHGALWHQPLRYVPDPVATAFDSSIDDVQHPRQTLARLAGDCDDLTVLLASLYESVGLSTVILTTPGHVLLGVDAGLLAGGNLLLDLPPERFVEVDGALFVPVEATAIGVDFAEAWRLGSEVVARADGAVEAFRTRDAWRRFPAQAWSDAPPARLAVKGGGRSGALPQVRVPHQGADLHLLARTTLAWLGGEAGAAETMAEACDEGLSEACYNLAVMLVSSTEIGPTDPFPPPVLDALCLMPAAVVTMMLDQGGLARGDEQSEASEAAETRRRLEEVLKKARERQEALEAEGLTDVKLKGDPTAGRRGRPASEAQEVAPLFFYAKIGG